MLLNLHVKNLAIIDESEVEFSDHLNILTGETGAGKSILLGSINLALGMKASAELIRKGSDYGLVELIFDMDEPAREKLRKLDIPFEDSLVILSRKIMKGRSLCKINGETVTAAALKEVAGLLIDIHGQHEHQSLLYKEKHLEILDRFGKEEAAPLKEQIKGVFHDWQGIRKKKKEIQIPEEERLREISFLEYETGEIEKAAIHEGEDEELELTFRRLSNSNALVEGLGGAYQLLSDSPESVSEGISRAGRMLSRVAEYDEAVEGYYSQLLEIDGLLNDLNRELAGYVSELKDNTGELAGVEERLNLVNGLKAKYGGSLAGVEAYYQKAKEKLAYYQNYEEEMEKLSKEESLFENRLKKLSGRLTQIRKKYAAELEKKIREALLDLNFNDVRFSIQFSGLPNFTENGTDEAEFYISTNPGEDIKPLGRVASGGELSRIMLAIKSVLADSDSVGTLIFDEIDAGISGRTAQKVSEKLSVISASRQVICITHLPQIAAMADTHFIIEKRSTQDQTKSIIRRLDEKESVYELARIIGGAKITDTVLKNAEEMKKLAEQTKQHMF